jgi:hypothetical protein
VVIEGIGPKHVEATPAGIGLQFERPLALDPALGRHRIVEQMGSIDKIDPTRRRQAPFFSA